MADAALLSPQDPAWTEALDRVRHDIYHIPEYVRLDAGLTGGIPVAFRYDEAGQVFLLPLLLRPVPDTDLRDATSPYGYPGPVGSVDDAFWARAFGAMTEMLCTQGIDTVFTRLHPLLPACHEALIAAGTVVHHGQTVSIDLTLSRDEIWSQTHRSHRNQINKAIRAGVEIVFDDWTLFDAWIQTYHATMRRVGAADFYFFDAGYFHGLRTALGDHLHLAVAVHDGQVLGGNLFFEYAGIMHTHLQSTADGFVHYADKLLYHAVRTWGRDRGNTVYHLGGGVGGSADSLFRYKSQFAAGRLKRGVGGRPPRRAGNVEAPAQLDAVVTSHPAPGILDGLAAGLGGDPPHDRRMRAEGHLGVPHRLGGQAGADVIGQRGHIFGVADQIHHRQVHTGHPWGSLQWEAPLRPARAERGGHPSVAAPLDPHQNITPAFTL